MILSLVASVSAFELKWFHASSGFYFDRWTGKAVTEWEKRDTLPTPPQVLRAASIGAMFKITSMDYVDFSIPYFVNEVEPYKDGLATNEASANGVGDINLVYARIVRMGRLLFSFHFPGDYETEKSTSANANKSAWAGFGVVRAGLFYELSNDNHYFYIGGNRVISNWFANDPLVHIGDHDFSIGYVRKHHIIPEIKMSYGIDYSYKSYRWGEKDEDPLTEKSIDPSIAVSYLHTWQHEFKVTLGATLLNDVKSTLWRTA